MFLYETVGCAMEVLKCVAYLAVIVTGKSELMNFLDLFVKSRSQIKVV